MTATEWLWSDYVSTIVSSGGTDAPSSGSSESWTVSSSTGFPAASNSASPPTVFDIVDPNVPTETMRVTNVSGSTWTVTRGADSTIPVAHTANFTVWNVTSAGALSNMAQLGNTVNFGATTIVGGLTVDTVIASGQVEAQDGLLLDEISAPSTPTAGSVLYSNSTSGLVDFVDPQGNVNFTGRWANQATTQTLNSTSFVKLFGTTSPSFAAIPVHIRGQILCDPTTNAGSFAFQFAGTASYTFLRMLWEELAYASGASDGNGIDYALNGGVMDTNISDNTFQGAAFGTSNRIYRFDGVVLISSAGTIYLEGRCTTATDTIAVQEVGSYIEYTPMG